jgi:histone deacetylase 1/2
VREDIYVSAPKGMNINNNKVLKLNKALYGIKQAPHEWNVEIDKFILSLGFRKCVKDTCVYVKNSKTQHIIILGLFVDDMIISYNEIDEDEWFEMKRKLMGKYELSDEGEAKVIVGMRLTKKNGYIYVDQRAYIREKLDEFRLSECRESPTPATKIAKENSENTCKFKQKHIAVNKQLYMQMVGSLIYALHTRPDITHAVNIVCRYMSDPQHQHMIAAKHVFRYLRGTTDYGLKYQLGECNYVNSFEITGFSDASWADNKEDRKSTAGHCVFVNTNLITWCTRKQQVVATSTTESELIAVFEVVKEMMWISMLLTEMGLKVKKPMRVWCDNRSTVFITKNDSDHDRTKHIDIRVYYVRDLVKSNHVIIEWIETGKQTADIFTKPLNTQAFQAHRNALVHDVNEYS